MKKRRIDIAGPLARRRKEREVDHESEDGVGHDLLDENEVVRAKDVEVDHVREEGEGNCQMSVL